MVRGFAYLCSACGHGGHPAHLKRWFEQSSECPTGCGCLCGEYSLNVTTNLQENISSSSLQNMPIKSNDSSSNLPIKNYSDPQLNKGEVMLSSSYGPGGVGGLRMEEDGDYGYII